MFVICYVRTTWLVPKKFVILVTIIMLCLCHGLKLEILRVCDVVLLLFIIFNIIFIFNFIIL
jgi:hypothetical protein